MVLSFLHCRSRGLHFPVPMMVGRLKHEPQATFQPWVSFAAAHMEHPAWRVKGRQKEPERISSNHDYSWVVMPTCLERGVIAVTSWSLLGGIFWGLLTEGAWGLAWRLSFAGEITSCSEDLFKPHFSMISASWLPTLFFSSIWFKQASFSGRGGLRSLYERVSESLSTLCPCG